MINAVIIDDEPINITNLQYLLQTYCPEVFVVQTALNAQSGIQAILTHQPDLVLLDIQMPEQNGFDLLRALPHNDFELIFVTAYDQYGIQAVKFSAIDYLLKPLDAEELKAAIAKVAGHHVHKKINLHLQNLLDLLKHSAQHEEHRLALPSVKETRFVYTKEIIRCESCNSYTTFHLQYGEKIMVSVSMYEYEEMLTPYGFIRCHQSHLVNRKFIKSMVKESGGYLLLQDGTKVPVSRHKKEQVRREIL
jgi:two-component system LytT family response regulator